MKEGTSCWRYFFFFLEISEVFREGDGGGGREGRIVFNLLGKVLYVSFREVGRVGEIEDFFSFKI